ncbi:Hypothetical_protein [Hexamita inflata]|uniref:Hypothetical_protein n=1 Tax=Hexamita inflata TaxID=28002 RepID=A0AA86RLV2_9EUKA|nr:Hypothetical protein HINF_LOCUS64601 [Hexamita inflata]
MGWIAPGQGFERNILEIDEMTYEITVHTITYTPLYFLLKSSKIHIKFFDSRFTVNGHGFAVGHIHQVFNFLFFNNSLQVHIYTNFYQYKQQYCSSLCQLYRVPFIVDQIQCLLVPFSDSLVQDALEFPHYVHVVGSHRVNFFFNFEFFDLQSEFSAQFIQFAVEYSYGRWNCFFLFTM